MSQLTKQCWYHINLADIETTQYLRNTGKGAFVVRKLKKESVGAWGSADSLLISVSTGGLGDDRYANLFLLAKTVENLVYYTTDPKPVPKTLWHGSIVDAIKHACSVTVKAIVPREGSRPMQEHHLKLNITAAKKADTAYTKHLKQQEKDAKSLLLRAKAAQKAIERSRGSKKARGASRVASAAAAEDAMMRELVEAEGVIESEGEDEIFGNESERIEIAESKQKVAAVVKRRSLDEEKAQKVANIAQLAESAKDNRHITAAWEASQKSRILQERELKDAEILAAGAAARARREAALRDEQKLKELHPKERVSMAQKQQELRDLETKAAVQNAKDRAEAELLKTLKREAKDKFLEAHSATAGKLRKSSFSRKKIEDGHLNIVSTSPWGRPSDNKKNASAWKTAIRVPEPKSKVVQGGMLWAMAEANDARERAQRKMKEDALALNDGSYEGGSTRVPKNDIDTRTVTPSAMMGAAVAAYTHNNERSVEAPVLKVSASKSQGKSNIGDGVDNAGDHKQSNTSFETFGSWLDEGNPAEEKQRTTSDLTR